MVRPFGDVLLCLAHIDCAYWCLHQHLSTCFAAVLLSWEVKISCNW
jgi:hypothetical protein